jgi:F0F1-type ATP synthase assembly protein I
MDPEHTPKPDKSSDKPPPESSLTGAGAMTGLGLQFALSILLFLWLGQWFDRKFGTDPLFLILFVFLGAGASFYSIYRKLMAQQRREDEERKRS